MSDSKKCRTCKTELSLDKYNKKPNGELTSACSKCLILNKVKKEKYLCVHKVQSSQCKECNIDGALRKNIMARIRKFSKFDFDVFGCSIDEYKVYLESKFKDGMTLQNYKSWMICQIDYIKPRDSEDVIRAKLHYTNTIPLPISL